INAAIGATYANGYATWPETDKSTTGVEGACVQDYKQSSAGINPTRDCNYKGQWQEVSNNCIPVTCPYLDDNTNNVEWPEVIPGSNTSIEVSGTCNTGYEPADNADYPVRLCNRDGTWGSMIVGCVAKKCDNSELNTLNQLSNSEYNYTSLGISPTGTSDYGTTLNGDCSTGYEKTNLGSAISATCNSAGEWEFIPSTDTGLCQIKTCTIASATSAVSISNLSSWTLCSNSSCSSTGTTYPSTSTTTLNYGSYIKFNGCNTGYGVSGSTIMQCTDTNTWSVIGTGSGVCVAQCTWSTLNALTYSTTGLTSTLLTSVNNWYDGTGTSITKPTSAVTYYNSGTVYQVDCPTGYTTTTKKKITCNTGIWNTTTTDICTIKTCTVNDLNDEAKIDALTDPNIASNATNESALKSATFNTTGTVQHLSSTSSIGCKTGYTSSGSISMICDDGVWTWNTANNSTNFCATELCAISTATAASGILNMSLSTTGWTLCSDSSCSSTSTIYSATASTTLDYGSYIKFNGCNTGYILSGSAIMQCSGTNTWSVVGTSSGVCVAQCTWSTLNALTYSTTGLTSTLLTSVNNWYDGTGTSITKPTSAVTYYNSGTVYQVDCPTGYTTTTKKKITCNTGIWNTTTTDICSANACSTATLTAYKTANLPALANITIGASDTIASSATKTYTCNTGYSGSIVLSCSAGSVTGYTGSCSPTCTGSSLASKISNASQTSWYTCPTVGTSCTSGGTVSAAATIYAQNTYAYLNACNTGYTKSTTGIYKCTATNTWTVQTAATCNANGCINTSLPSSLTSSYFTNLLVSTTPSSVSWYTTSTGSTSVTVSSGSTTSGAIIYATCPTGYATTTRLAMSCSLGNWSKSTTGVCSANACSTATLTAYKTNNSLPITIGGSDTIASSATKTYTCNTGYSGSIVLSCSAGSVTGYTGSCTLIQCPSISPTSYVSNGIFTTTNGTCANGTSSMTCPGAVYTFSSCAANYTKVDNKTITCGSNGSWTASGTGWCARNCVNASLYSTSAYVRVTAQDYCSTCSGCEACGSSASKTIYSGWNGIGAWDGTAYTRTASANHGINRWESYMVAVRANGTSTGDGHACYVVFEVKATCYNGSFINFCISSKTAVADYESNGTCGGSCSNSWTPYCS
ncbi:MAG: hypothetical protein PHY80_02035, partial [Rickettsiales bacterium]|nr:hypothetical protein [Rickettsiales bacterium]